jgi:hypothetical protein
VAHKRSHTVAAVTARTGELLGDKTIQVGDRGFAEALGWARDLGAERVWALEDCRHVSGAFERFLLVHGERVVRVATRLMAGERRAGRDRDKSDRIDAHGNHRGGAGLHGVDDFGVVDALQVDGQDAKVAVAGLALAVTRRVVRSWFSTVKWLAPSTRRDPRGTRHIGLGRRPQKTIGVGASDPGDVRDGLSDVNAREIFSMLEERRRSFEQVMWQVPSLSIAAQAFLFSAAFASGTPRYARALRARHCLAARPCGRCRGAPSPRQAPVPREPARTGRILVPAQARVAAAVSRGAP